MKLILSLCTVLSLVGLPLAADPLALVAVNGATPGTLLRYSEHGVTTITTQVAGAIGVTKGPNGNYWVVNGSALLRVTPTGNVSTIVNAPSGSPNAQWVALTTDAAGKLIVADNAQHAIWRIIPGSPLSAVTKIANYPVADPSELEDIGVLVDGSGNYIVLEDNHPEGDSNAVHLFSITPAGTVTPIPLSGASVASCSGLVSDGAGNYLFGSYIDDAVYRMTPAGVVTQIAHPITGDPFEHVVSLALNPDSGDIYAATGGRILQVSADGSFVRAFANGGSASIVAETYGALPHLAAGDVWTSGFYVLNTGNRPASYAIDFYGNSGNAVSLPFPGGNFVSSHGTLPAQGMDYVEVADATAPLKVAWGLISADPTITVQALFRDHSVDGNYYEAGVPASAGSTAFSIPFDATTFAATGANLYTGFAVANLDPADSATVTCVATDSTGATIPNGVTIPELNPLGHYANFLFPALTGKRGTLDCSSNTRMAAIALRFIGATAFSSLPVLYK